MAGWTVLALELSENALRRNYSVEDRKRLVENLEAQGLKTKRGRPKPGEQRMIKALMERLGASRSTVNRLLAKTRAAGTASSDTIPKPKGRPKKMTVKDPADAETAVLAPSDALEPASRLDPVVVAHDAVKRMGPEELELFSSWFGEHAESVKVPVEDLNA